MTQSREAERPLKVIIFMCSSSGASIGWHGNRRRRRWWWRFIALPCSMVQSRFVAAATEDWLAVTLSCAGAVMTMKHVSIPPHGNAYFAGLYRVL